MNILLVEPNFPYSTKSRNKANAIHKNFVPIGLLKIASYYKSSGHAVRLVRGNVDRNAIEFRPHKILITTLFTYWSQFVWDSVRHYRALYPNSEILLGGIYTTLHSGESEFKALLREYNVSVHVGLHLGAEKHLPDYSLVPELAYHATHMMRGCIRRCSFCGTWKIEPQRTFKSRNDIVEEILSVGKNKVIFYDNNILANPKIKDILLAFCDLRLNGRPVEFESQSGFDGRLLDEDLAVLLKRVRFKNPRIAWDGLYDDRSKIKQQIEMLVNAGYSRKDIYVFMIFNYNFDFKQMEQKRRECWKWRVQIADCRYRPLTQTHDRFNARKIQSSDDYYIHAPMWSDFTIKLFRKNVRRQNICVRHGFPFYSKLLENMHLSKAKSLELRLANEHVIKRHIPDAWFPEESVDIRLPELRGLELAQK